MSIKNIHDNLITERDLSDNVPVPWVRNPSWLTLPNVTGTEQKIVGLYAIYPGKTNPAIVTISGNYQFSPYTGGAFTNYTAGTSANINYNYDDVAYDNTNAPVTLSNSVVFRTGHGYSNRMTVNFYNIVTTPDIIDGVTYYVVNATQNTFQVSAVLDGTPVTFVSTGSATLLPYKQSIITIIPQSGQSLTSVNLNVRHTGYSSQQYSTGWLDIGIGGPSISSLSISGNQVYHKVLEQCTIYSFSSTMTSLVNLFMDCNSLQSVSLPTNTSNIIDMSSMFARCHLLQTLPLFDTSKTTSMMSMFSDCYSLVSVPLFNTSSCTNISSMFRNCYLLSSVPLFNTIKVTDISGMLYGCKSLELIPFFNTSTVTNMNNMFTGCSLITEVPLFNTINVNQPSGMAYMFYGCSSLRIVPKFDTTNVKGMYSMFRDCNSLLTVPDFNTPNVTNMQMMFYSCYCLQSVPLFDTSKVTDMLGMFQNCWSLKTIPLFDTSSVTSVNGLNQTFYRCYTLQSIPALNLSNVVSLTSTFFGCSSLSSFLATGIKVSFSLSNCNLSGPALNTLYNNLGTGVTGKTITVSGNWGTTSDNPALVPSGWTVIGS